MISQGLMTHELLKRRNGKRAAAYYFAAAAQICESIICGRLVDTFCFLTSRHSYYHFCHIKTTAFEVTTAIPSPETIPIWVPATYVLCVPLSVV